MLRFRNWKYKIVVKFFHVKVEFFACLKIIRNVMDLPSQALKEEKTIHEKVTIVKVYLNSVAMAVHRISKEDPAKLLGKFLLIWV